ncbi:Hypothetical predicted protein [Scomber scombrus]|uniref:Uncharacterized protein n=1 Tax=Scomber scombrus TaxID=13677 RepID=A0AAV1NED0_SCOSC
MADYGEEVEYCVFKKEDSAFLFKEDPLPSHRYHHWMICPSFESAVDKMVTHLPPQPLSKTPTKDFTAGLLAQPCRRSRPLCLLSQDGTNLELCTVFVVSLLTAKTPVAYRPYSTVEGWE